MRTIVGSTSNSDFQVKGGMRYVFSFTIRSNNDLTGSSFGQNTGTLTPKLKWRESYTRTTTDAVKATLTTALTGTNNDLRIDAKTGGLLGNSITIAYIDPGAINRPLSVTLSGYAITVNLATNGSGVITTTANDIGLALTSTYPDVAALIDVITAPGNDGTGVVTVMAAAGLTGGANAITATDYPQTPFLDANGVEITYDLTAKKVGSFEFRADADGALEVTVASGTALKLVFFNLKETVQ